MIKLGHRWWRGCLSAGLAVATIGAISVSVVATGAGLLIRNLTHLQSLDVGFDREQTLTVAVAMLDEKYAQPGVAHQLFDDLVRWR